MSDIAKRPQTIHAKEDSDLRRTARGWVRVVGTPAGYKYKPVDPFTNRVGCYNLAVTLGLITRA